jgi:uncharacterized membrane protein YtjA (UPF0391 family)
MMRYSVLFLVVAIVAALLGFTGIASSAAWIAQTLFFVFLALFLVMLIASFVQEARIP